MLISQKDTRVVVILDSLTHHQIRLTNQDVSVRRQRMSAELNRLMVLIVMKMQLAWILQKVSNAFANRDMLMFPLRSLNFLEENVLNRSMSVLTERLIALTTLTVLIVLMGTNANVAQDLSMLHQTLTSIQDVFVISQKHRNTMDNKVVNHSALRVPDVDQMKSADSILPEKKFASVDVEVFNNRTESARFSVNVNKLMNVTEMHSALTLTMVQNANVKMDSLMSHPIQLDSQEENVNKFVMNVPMDPMTALIKLLVKTPQLDTSVLAIPTVLMSLLVTTCHLEESVALVSVFGEL